MCCSVAPYEGKRTLYYTVASNDVFRSVGLCSDRNAPFSKKNMGYYSLGDCLNFDSYNYLRIVTLK